MSSLEKNVNTRAKIALLVTLIGVIIPFISYNEIHLLLFNFYDGRFEFLFQVWEVSLVSLVVIFVLFAIGVILVFNFAYSRYFCGTICPKTILKNVLTDFIEAKLFKITRIKNRQNGEKIENHKLKLMLSYMLFFVFVFIASIPFFFYLLPHKTLWRFMTEGFESGYEIFFYLWIIVSLYLYAEALFFKEFFCSYLCPYQFVNSVTVNDKRGYYDFYDKENCIECDACVRVCPVPKLDIKEGFDLRCISCGDCSAVCEDVMLGENVNHTLIEYNTLSHAKQKSKLFAFGDKKVSMILIFLTIVILSASIFYLVDISNLGYCNFSNKELYK